MQSKDSDDVVPVDDGALLVDGEHPVAVAVERDTEVEVVLGHRSLQSAQVGRAAALVDVRPIRLNADRRDDRAESLERARRDLAVGAVGAVDADLEAGEVRAEALDDVIEVAVVRNADAIDLAAARCSRVEQRLDLLLVLVAQLLPLAVEELDAVVLRRIVRCGDHGSDVQRQQRDRRCREYSRQDGGAAGRRDAATQRLFELDAGCARVPTDEHAASSRPERDRLAEPLDQLGCQALADNPADAVCSEVSASHRRAELTRPRAGPSTQMPSAKEECASGRGDRALRALRDATTQANQALKAQLSALAELRRLARLVQTGLLPLDDPRGPREVLLDRPSVEPRRPVTRPQDHAGNRRLSLAGSLVLRDLRLWWHQSSNGSGLGACASCGCSGP